MKTEIIAKETIKPSSPTPKSFNLCIMDQVSPPVFTKLYFFYENTSTDAIEDVIAKRTQALKSSLSEVLTRYYPFVGRIRDQATLTIEEDDGAEFLEARVDSTLKEYLEKPTPEMFQQLVPRDLWEGGTRPLLHVQASFFKCGGLAIGMNISHKVSDAGTFTNFINAWADTAIGKSDQVPNPDFSGHLAFPALGELLLCGEEAGKFVKINDKTKRFVFTASKLAALQETAKNENIPWTSRVEVVTTFIFKIGTKMCQKRKGGSPVPSVLITTVNLRRRMEPPICDHTFGNLFEYQIVENESSEFIDLPHLITKLRETIKVSIKYYEKKLDGQQIKERFMGIRDKMMQLMPQPDVFNGFTISSWNKFPFYEADFGWGKPIWVANHNPTPYVTTLMDTRDGTGIEAWVNLPEEKMAIFANDEELLTYAITDPSAL